MNPEQEKVRCLLVDTITLLCRNGLTFASDVKVQGLLAITIDSKEFFVIQIDETLAENLDDDDDDNAIECADQPGDDQLDEELSNQPMTISSVMRKAEVENSSESRPPGRKRVRRRMVSNEINDNKNFCAQSSQPNFFAGNYPDRFAVNSRSSVSAPQVKVEDDDLLLVDSSGHSVIGQNNYDYGNSGGDFRPSRSDFCGGLIGASGVGLSSRSGPHQVKSRQKRKRSSGTQQQWNNSYERVEWSGQGDDVGSSLLPTNYDLDETEEKPNQHGSQQDMTTAASLHPTTQLTDVDWSLIDNVAQQQHEEKKEENAENNEGVDGDLVTPGRGGRGGHGGLRGRGGLVSHGGRGGHGARKGAFVFNPRRHAISSSSSSSSLFDKPFACRFPGCEKRFCHETHTRRHEREMHNFYRQRQRRHLHQQQQPQQHHQQQQQPSSSSSVLVNSSVSSDVFAASSSSSSSAQLNGSTRHRIQHQHRHHHQHHQQQQQQQHARATVALDVATKLASTTISSLLHVFSNSSDQQTL